MPPVLPIRPNPPICQDTDAAASAPVPVRVGGRLIGVGQPCFIVAEVGINHNGDMALARQSIDMAAQAGADSVKFQNYRTEDFISDRSLTYEYVSQGRTVVESQWDMFKRCQLDREQLAKLKAHCDHRGVVFMSTPTSRAGIDDLQAVGCPMLKNGSDFLTQLELIRAMGETGLPTVLSTGMAVRSEIEDAVEAFRDTGNKDLILLHCTSSYPTPPEDVNLRRIPELAELFQCIVGFSDHTNGTAAATVAAATGACFIEKHFTLDKTLPGPDHHFSMDPEELSTLVAAVRDTETYLGRAEIGPAPSEESGRQQFRLSCVAAHDLPAGHMLLPDDLVFRRPGTGLPPKAAAGLVGRTLSRNLGAGAVLCEEDMA